ncbi:hypothetical protein EYB53_023960 [Candidatus Chloroploca sp. M-50]|uniref:LITAF domain-containing protein n=1 Tax=Candidatus Chloroploca mongolica TaxID=2528176 RepID=A0ABS4DH60_9CHLR|nr:hypothetical protein [Candidatus Chloroploca mongolica]MBP1468787.1 hypothetical protein [Candidatus Chloroploca mongolica]
MSEVICSQCGGIVEPNWTKISMVIGGAVGVTFAASTLGVSGGIMGLGFYLKALQGNTKALQIVRLKTTLSNASHKQGGFFKCSRCKNDVSIDYYFQKIFLDNSSDERMDSAKPSSNKATSTTESLSKRREELERIRDEEYYKGRINEG